MKRVVFISAALATVAVGLEFLSEREPVVTGAVSLSPASNEFQVQGEVRFGRGTTFELASRTVPFELVFPRHRAQPNDLGAQGN